MPSIFANSVSSQPRPTFLPGFSGVPRCRTRIDPPVTVSPPNALTPNRCAFESRPFLELPKPFLCAISHLRQNLVYRHACEVLPVSDRSFILLLPFELEDNYFVAAAVRLDRAFHLGAGQIRPRNQFVRIPEQRHNPAEFDLGTRIAFQRFHFNRVAGSNPVLLSTCLDYRVHGLGFP